MRLPLAVLAAAALLTTGCPKKTPEAPVTPDSSTAEGSQALSPGDSGTPGSAMDGAGSDSGTATREACVDRWLQEHHLDRYGHPEGTMYAGGSPLFNEATGETQDRLEHVFARQPDARTACP